MTAQDKTIIWNLLKTSSDSINGFKSPDFPDEMPDFQDDKVISEKIQAPSPAAGQALSTTQTTQPDTHTATQTTHQAASQAHSSPAASTLDLLNRKISECTRCSLYKDCHGKVSGNGCETPAVMVILDPPSFEEDMAGKCGTGESGNLLEKMLSSIGLSTQSNVFITNIVKCRPLNRANPYPEEADACSSFLDGQLTVLKPKIIYCLGSAAARCLLKTEHSVSKLRGQVFEYKGIPVLVSFSPAAILKDQTLKRPAWEDLKNLRQKISEI